jgi:uncharacterized protein (DUF2062 family)
LLLLETLKLGLPTGLASLIRIAYILFPLLITLEIAAEFGWLEKVSEQLAGACRQLGFPPQAALPLVAGLIIGFTYSAGVILASVKEGQWSEHELTLLWIVLSLSHAIIEDTAIFAAMGLSVPALLAVRLVPTVLVMLGLNYYFRGRTWSAKANNDL